MEDLTKSQVVLLCLFVSFVSSMATGIVTVTLMQQSPEPVTQSITSVVERTIERIAPASPTIIERQGNTVVVKDEDLMVSAIEKNMRSVVSFRTIGADGETYLAGIGVIVSEDGLVVTDKQNTVGTLTTTIEGVRYTFDLIPSSDEKNPLALGKLTPIGGATGAQTFAPATLGGEALKIGQTAIVIGGREGKTITPGLVSSLDVRSEGEGSGQALTSFTVSQRLVASLGNGAPVVLLDGTVAGFLSINDAVGTQVGIPAAFARGLVEEAVR